METRNRINLFTGTHRLILPKDTSSTAYHRIDCKRNTQIEDELEALLEKERRNKKRRMVILIKTPENTLPIQQYQIADTLQKLSQNPQNFISIYVADSQKAKHFLLECQIHRLPLYIHRSQRITNSN